MDKHASCPLCNPADADIIHANEFGLILKDNHPVTHGHALVIPRRHVASFFEVSDKERKSLVSLIELARNELKMIYHPTGFHVTFVDGDVNGEIEHLHIHILPRYSGQALKLDRRWGIVSPSGQVD